MPASDDVQRRHRQRDDSRRGHPLQHRDRNRDVQRDRGHQPDRGTLRDRGDEGWADRGTWTNLDDETQGGPTVERGDARDNHRRREGESVVDHVHESVGQNSEPARQSDAAQGFGWSPQGNSQRRSRPDRAPGGSGTPSSRSHDNPRTGSHRDADSGVGSSGQFGDRHGPRPSAAESAGYHGDDHYGGQKGGSTADRRFGSRRGHGSGRREDPRVRDRE